jgi:hypothetical protein
MLASCSAVHQHVQTRVLLLRAIPCRRCGLLWAKLTSLLVCACTIAFLSMQNLDFTCHMHIMYNRSIASKP